MAGWLDWPAQQRAINTFNHYRADVNGVGLHYIYAKGNATRSIPLLVLHGWPSSFVQMLDIIPLLTGATHQRPSFDIVVASLPGYGFSDIPKEPGMSVARIAGLMTTLMTEVLGYPRFAARGGHFLEWEEPQLVADDVRAFFAALA